MKHITRIACLFMICFGGTLSAELVHYGNYTSQVSGFNGEVVDGDLIIINGNLDFKETLTVNGDLKVTGGYVRLHSDIGSTSTVNLYVHGDVIITNTAGNAYVYIQHGSLNVTGAIYTRGTDDDSSVEVLGDIRAGRIITNGFYEAYVRSNEGSIEVEGEIITRCMEGDGHIVAEGNIKAASISTNGYGDLSGEVEAGEDIIVGGSIVTRSEQGAAYVRAAQETEGGIEAKSIFTKGRYDSSVSAGDDGPGYITVADDIVTRCEEDEENAYVQTIDRDLKAGNISTWAKGEEGAHAYVRAISEGDDCDIEVQGKIITRSESGDAYVRAYENYEGNIYAKDIVTYGHGDSSVQARNNINVEGRIVTKDWEGSASVSVDDGDIHAGYIATDAKGDSDGQVYTDEEGSIVVKGTITTKGTGYAYVAANDGSISAENIYTDGGFGSSHIFAENSLTVKNQIKTRSESDNACVDAGYNISARTILTDAENDGYGYVRSIDGSIETIGDIKTKAQTQADVQATTGNINARSINMKSVSGTRADYFSKIIAAPGSAKFQLVPTQNADVVVIENGEFDLDRDHYWNTKFDIRGTCTINGKGHSLTFEQYGEIEVNDGASLFLKNIKLDKIRDTVIRCDDDSSILLVEDVVWSQTGDYNFNQGKLKIVGDLLITGSGTTFKYETNQQSIIDQNAAWMFDTGVTLSYDTSLLQGIVMVDNSSRLAFNDAILHAAEDIRLTKGTVVFDNLVTASAEAGKTIYFGDGNASNNLALEFHTPSQFDFYGDLVNANA